MPQLRRSAQGLAARCELCGHELAGVSASKTVTDLVQKFNGIEAALDAAGLHGSKRIKELVAAGRIICDFPIPNARRPASFRIYYIGPKLQYCPPGATSTVSMCVTCPRRPPGASVCRRRIACWNGICRTTATICVSLACRCGHRDHAHRRR